MLVNLYLVVDIGTCFLKFNNGLLQLIDVICRLWHAHSTIRTFYFRQTSKIYFSFNINDDFHFDLYSGRWDFRLKLCRKNKFCCRKPSDANSDALCSLRIYDRFRGKRPCSKVFGRRQKRKSQRNIFTLNILFNHHRNPACNARLCFHG